MSKHSHLQGIVAPLCDWFEAGRRLLPWRIEPTPYRVWISEIMLQQTRIEAVIPYFERFMNELPDVQALASVAPDRLMKLWEGLGYYSRARNLQKAAQQMIEHYGGELPADYHALLSLSGIGEYTAGAIASIAFGIPVPAVDGNVLRVLARLTGSHEDVMKPAVRKELTALAASLVPTDRPASFNQGLMELGERVCVPNTMPRCEACPIAEHCAVSGSPEAATLPYRAPKKPRRIEQRTVYVMLTDEHPRRVLLHKRPEEGLLAGLWELPNTEGNEPLPLTVQAVGESMELTNSRHIFSHIEWHMHGVLQIVKPFAVPDDYEFAGLTALLTDHALPTAFRAYSQMLPTWLGESK
ncbi:MAG: A/G-specific adenine glycosylase [Ruminococcaceae bacterium]|nr:A/G-specific adenine glycosylase [Oscillospiraceae bacterium]